jgi:hypothetical protein
VRKVLLAVLALTVSTLAAPTAAQAEFGDLIEGGCFFDTVDNPPPDGDVKQGVIGDLSVTTKGPLTGATVSCWIEVNGLEAPGTRFSYSGYGVQAGADPISFVAGVGDPYWMCQSVVFADGTSQSDCANGGPAQIPPQFVIDILNADVWPIVDPLVVSTVDPLVCSVLVPLAGSYPGGITIAPDGDIYVADPFGLDLSPYYDCPPYGNF